MQLFWRKRSAVSTFKVLYVWKVVFKRMYTATKKWSQEQLGSRLEEAAGIMKSVYRSEFYRLSPLYCE